MSFHSARTGLIQANHFGNLHFSQRGGYRTPLEDFTGVSRLPSDTVQMIPALTGWIAAYGKKNGNRGSRHMQRCISFYGSSVTWGVVAILHQLTVFTVVAVRSAVFMIQKWRYATLQIWPVGTCTAIDPPLFLVHLK